MRRILILGCGYVGRALALRKLEQGHYVLAVTRNRNAAKRLQDAGIDVFVGNVHESEWHSFASDIDWAINCVSAASPDLEGYQTSYVEGNRSFVQWMRHFDFAGKAIFTSSVSVYPDCEGEWVVEGDAKPHSDRARILLDAEDVFLKGPESVARTVLRLGGIYGPDRSFLVDRVRASGGILPGFGDYYLNLIRLEDIVSALEATLYRDSTDAAIYNVVDSQPVLRTDLVADIARHLRMSPPQFDPSRIPERSSRRTRGDRPANRRISNKKLREELDWEPSFLDARVGMESLLSS